MWFYFVLHVSMKRHIINSACIEYDYTTLVIMWIVYKM